MALAHHQRVSRCRWEVSEISCAGPDKTVIPYGSTGVRSAATYFTLLGYPHVSQYSGSWDAWSKHPELRTSIGRKP